MTNKHIPKPPKTHPWKKTPAMPGKKKKPFAGREKPKPEEETVVQSDKSPGA